MLTLYKATLKQAKDIKDIYNEAFPRKERKPFHAIVKSMKKGRMELVCAKNEAGEIVGFGTCFPYKDMVYLDYLAMSYSCRGKGYGSEYLEKLFKLYDGKRLSLIMERVDEPCNNLKQREKRKQFYLNNGMCETHLYCKAISGNYEILVHGGKISGEEFIEIMNYSLGKLYAFLAKYHIV